jgi:pyruvate/2-oxoglutarate dehydrogenase complex dihydrolipoamide acyltransferase (E2) component
LNLKNQLAALTGDTSAAAPPAAQKTENKDSGAKKANKAGESNESKKAAPKEAAKPKASETKSTAPAKAAPVAIARSVDINASVWNNNEVDVTILDAKLKVYSYVTGFTPKQEDNRVFDFLSNKHGAALDIVLKDNKNTSRWLRNMKSFSVEEKKAWA